VAAKPSTARRSRARAPDAECSSAPLNKYDLYRLCVQAPKASAEFLAAVHARFRGTRAPARQVVLREDFSGPGAIGVAWAESSERHATILVDQDADALAHAGLPRPRVAAIAGDVMAVEARADIVAALNFPLGYWHSRKELVAYLQASLARLRPGGVFVADMYGGEHAFQPGTLQRRVLGPNDEAITYTWEQREADVVSGIVVDALHFDIKPPKRPLHRLRDAFVYTWRLWSLPELRDALRDAGFRRIEFFDQLAGARDQRGRLHVEPVSRGEELGDDWVAYVAAGRKP